jgi:energy-coupling factor transporter ATP-binding protein EcfA2
MSKLILLNGPIGCGKSEAVKFLKIFYPNMKERRCKDKLFKLVPEFFCISEERFWEIYDDREIKEKPMPEFTITQIMYENLRRITNGPEAEGEFVEISVRDAMIYVSEIVCKPTFGQDYFGVARAKSIEEGELAIDDSCGFAGELPPVIEKVGKENILLLRIHGRGSFEGDSRGYMPDGTIPAPGS